MVSCRAGGSRSNHEFALFDIDERGRLESVVSGTCGRGRLAVSGTGERGRVSENFKYCGKSVWEKDDVFVK